ncbi:MAG: murein biosynthesis integral membrane protein MurJ [Alphaproteobacteria bacterium]|nr:murein biosynthesis integral membrane protein MurJ [Alphaproteobacteria bacterium]
MKQTHGIAAAAGIMALGIFLSRVLGYVREMLLAYHFGASPVTDAFYAAFQVPDLLNYFLAGGALSIAFIPLYNKTLAREGEQAAEDMMAAVLGTLGVIAIVATAILMWQTPFLTRLQFPAFDDATTAMTIDLTRIVLPAQIFFLTGGIVQAVLLARKHFIAAAFAPLVYNICIIAGGVLLHSCCGIFGFAYGTLLGAALGPFLVPVLFARGHIPLKARFAPFDKRFLVYLVLALPLMLGQTLLTLDEWYGKWFGALLPAGTVAYISYARRLMQVPVAIAGQAVAAAALPTLSKLWAEGKAEEMNRAMTDTLCVSLSMAVILGAGICALAVPGIAFVYQHGAFTAEDTAAVAALVAVFAFAVPGWVVQQIAVRGFYARGDTWRPMVLGTVVSLGLIPLYLWLARLLSAEGIALAGVIGMTLNAGATILLARHMHRAPMALALAVAFGRAVLTAMPAGIAAWGTVYLRTAYLPLESLHVKWGALLDLALGGSVFLVVVSALTLKAGDARLKGFLQKKIMRFKGM